MADNVTFTQGNGNSISAICTQIAFSPNIVSSQDESALSQAFYPYALYYNNFTVSLLFTSIEERHTFYNWIKSWVLSFFSPYQGYGSGGIRSNTLKNSQLLLQVQGPNNFNFYGIPSTGMVEDTEPSDVVWTMQLQFTGGIPVNNNSFSGSISTYANPTSLGGANENFFPNEFSNGTATPISDPNANSSPYPPNSSQVQSIITNGNSSSLPGQPKS